jgi:hypothetical protein
MARTGNRRTGGRSPGSIRSALKARAPRRWTANASRLSARSTRARHARRGWRRARGQPAPRDVAIIRPPAAGFSISRSTIPLACHGATIVSRVRTSRPARSWIREPQQPCSTRNAGKPSDSARLNARPAPAAKRRASAVRRMGRAPRRPPAQPRPPSRHDLAHGLHHAAVDAGQRSISRARRSPRARSATRRSSDSSSSTMASSAATKAGGSSSFAPGRREPRD